MGCKIEGGCIEFLPGSQSAAYRNSGRPAAVESIREYRDEDRQNAATMGENDDSHRYRFVSGLTEPELDLNSSIGISGGEHTSFQVDNTSFVRASGTSKVRSTLELKTIADTYKTKISTEFKKYAGETLSASIGSGGDTWEEAVHEARLFFTGVK